MASRLRLAAALIALLAGLLCARSAGARQDGAICLLEINGIITPLTARYVERGLSEAASRGASLVVLALNTPGGQERAARAIVNAILHAPIPVVVYVSPAGARAASAGMFIAMAADITAMAPGSQLGARNPLPLGRRFSPDLAGQMLMHTEDLLEAIGAKRERFTSWMVTAVRSQALLSPAQALAQDVAEFTADDLPDLLRQLDGYALIGGEGATVLCTADVPIQELPMNSLESFLQLVSSPDIIYMLVTLGSALLLAEFSRPGLSLAGLTAAVCFLVAAVASLSLPVSWVGIILVMLALALLLASLMVDNPTLAAGVGLVVYITGSLLFFNPISISSPAEPAVTIAPWWIALGTAGLALVTAALLRALQRARQLPARSGAEKLLGMEGVAMGDLAPDGRISIALQTWSASTGTGFIHAGQRVMVVGTEGERLQVIALEPPSGESPAKPG